MSTKTLEQIFEIRQQKSPSFREISDDEYRQLECGLYNSWGRRLNITPRVLDENGIWTGEYKDWSHLEVIQVRQGYFEYLNADWLFLDLRPNKNFKHWCKEAYIFDKKCIVIQQIEHDSVSAKILTDDDELKIWIEDVLAYKPRSVVPKREIREINELEHHGLQFGSNQLKINVNTAEEKLDKQGLVITNIDHYDSYVYEVYDSLRNIFKHITTAKLQRATEAQCIWLEEWIERPLTNDINSIVDYMIPEVIKEFSKYVYKNNDVWDRDTYGYNLFQEVKTKEFSIDEMDYVVRYEKKMDVICKKLDIPITIGWDIWKILNIQTMKQIIEKIYEENPL